MIQTHRFNDPQATRYALLEAMIEEYEGLSSSAVSYVLGVSMGHAGRVMRAYLAQNKDAWEYHAKERLWKTSTTYIREYLETDSEAFEYIETYCKLTGMDEEDLQCQYED